MLRHNASESLSLCRCKVVRSRKSVQIHSAATNRAPATPPRCSSHANTAGNDSGEGRGSAVGSTHKGYHTFSGRTRASRHPWSVAKRMQLTGALVAVATYAAACFPRFQREMRPCAVSPVTLATVQKPPKRQLRGGQVPPIDRRELRPPSLCQVERELLAFDFADRAPARQSVGLDLPLRVRVIVPRLRHLSPDNGARPSRRAPDPEPNRPQHEACPARLALC